jgi:ATP adenylyltransferase
MEYILGERTGGCVFCQAAGSNEDEERYVLFRGNQAFVMLNAFPYISGHLLVSPYRHVADLVDLEEAELVEVMGLVQRSMRVLRAKLAPGGFNVGLNLGRSAGAGVVDHVHFHVVPRWTGDSNFMPAIAGANVLPEHLRDTYAKLAPGFRKEG